jgi:hypothetical protein
MGVGRVAFDDERDDQGCPLLAEIRACSGAMASRAVESHE